MSRHRSYRHPSPGNAPTRRQVLRGVLGGAAVTVALPHLPSLLSREARAADSLLPKRFGIVTWGNGVVPDKWEPTGTGADYTMSPELMPLADLRDHFSVVTGYEVKVPNRIPHFSGYGGILTGQAPLGEEGANTVAAPTIDQVIAAQIGNDTRFRSLELSLISGGTLSYNGPNSPNPPESSPHALFERVFGAGFTAPGEEVIIDPRLALRRSVLDAVMEQASSLQGRLGTEDKLRLDQHLSGVRDLERRLALLESDPPNLAACLRPDAPPEVIAALGERLSAHAELLAMALACDQTRVFSVQLSPPVNNYLYPDTTEGHHQLTHNEPGDQPQVHAITLVLMSYVSIVLGKLAALEEGGGTLLDNCAVLVTSDVSLGKTHSLDRYPIMVAGKAGGALRTGIHHQSLVRDNTTKVLLTLLRAMDLTLPSFGVGDTLTTDSIGELEA